MTDLVRLCLVCLRIGTFVFGGGLVMIPLMETDVVHRYGWLTKQEFVDAVALGQMTPGPLLVTATFVGYKVGGLLAALLATICMFLPSFVMTIAASKHLARVRDSKIADSFLWGVRASVVGLILSAGVSIGRASCLAPAQAFIAVGALIALMWKKIDAGLVVLTCGLLGLALWTN